MKLLSKTVLNAIIVFLSIAIVILLLLSTYFSNIGNNCNYQVTHRLINRTQQFVENQKLLIERTWDIDRRNVMEAVGNQKEQESAQERIPYTHGQYLKFLERMRDDENSTNTQLNKCRSIERTSSIFLIIALMIATFQFGIGLTYLKKYV